MEPTAQRYSRYHKLSDKAWRRVLLDSIDGQASLPMPDFPPADLQAGFIGSSNRQAILEAWKFYLLMREQRRAYGLTLTQDSHVLDFGCGWGRFARMFLREVPETNIWCADSMRLALDTCRETRVPAQFVQLNQMPPSAIPTAQFDTSFAYSVFSHLSPKAHIAWVNDFARVMKPNGLVFVTTQARWFIERCRTLRENPGQIKSPWEEKLAQSFLNSEDALQRYDRGEFLYEATGAGSQFVRRILWRGGSSTGLFRDPMESGF